MIFVFQSGQLPDFWSKTAQFYADAKVVHSANSAKKLRKKEKPHRFGGCAMRFAAPAG